MTETQIRVLIWDLFVNNPKLRSLNLTVREIGEMQDEAIKHADRLDCLSSKD